MYFLYYVIYIYNTIASIYNFFFPKKKNKEELINELINSFANIKKNNGNIDNELRFFSEIVDSTSRKYIYKDLYDVTNICNICLENFNNNDIIIMKRCNHIFHDNCIIEWHKIKRNCPVCRQ